MVRSGFPAIRTLSGRLLRAQLDGYLSRITERDLANVGYTVRDQAALRRWMTAYHRHLDIRIFRGHPLRRLGREERQASRGTTTPYRATLEKLWMIGRRFAGRSGHHHGVEANRRRDGIAVIPAALLAAHA